MRFALTGSKVVPVGGAVTVTLNGPPAWWRYDLTTVVLKCGLVAPTQHPTADVYRGYVDPARLLGHSRAADDVTFSCQPGDVLIPGDFLIVVFSGALVGSTAVANAFGEQVPMR